MNKIKLFKIYYLKKIIKVNQNNMKKLKMFNILQNNYKIQIKLNIYKIKNKINIIINYLNKP